MKMIQENVTSSVEGKRHLRNIPGDLVNIIDNGCLMPFRRVMDVHELKKEIAREYKTVPACSKHSYSKVNENLVFHMLLFEGFRDPNSMCPPTKYQIEYFTKQSERR